MHFQGMGSLIGKNSFMDVTAYYYSDGSGSVKHRKNGKLISMFYVTHSGHVNFMNDKLDPKYKKEVQFDVNTLMSKNLMNPT